MGNKEIKIGSFVLLTEDVKLLNGKTHKKDSIWVVMKISTRGTKLYDIQNAEGEEISETTKISKY